MSVKPKIQLYADLQGLVTRLRDDLNGGNRDFVLLYAYNGTGKTRLSMAFKDAGKHKTKANPDTLYFNAYTEDLFSWDNDLENDSERRLHINTGSKFSKASRSWPWRSALASTWGATPTSLSTSTTTSGRSVSARAMLCTSRCREAKKTSLSGACSWRSASA